jgi:DNA-binding FrmR family transcriptional regulator
MNYSYGEHSISREKVLKMAEQTKAHVHTHIAEDGTEYVHTHDADHVHNHSHTHKNTKAVLNRLSRASGHLEAVRRMVEDGKDCSDVLIQLSAVIAALSSTGKVILEDHIEHCIVDAVKSGDKAAIDNLNHAINRFIK